MKYEEITPTMRMFIGNREMVRRLGFEPGDIFFQLARSARHAGVLSCFLTIRQGDIEFEIECGPVAGESQAEAEYKRVAAAVNAHEIPDDDYFRMFEESEAYQQTAELITLLRARGMQLSIDVPSKARD